MSFIPVNFGMSSGGNTSGSSGTVSNQLVFAGGNNVTLSQSTTAGSATITISAGAGGAAGTNTFGMSNLGNTAGTSGTINGSAAQFLFAGGNNITLSQSTNGSSATITISGAAGGAAGTNTFGMSNLGNTSGTSGTINGSAAQFVLAGGNNVTLSQSLNGSSATITISAAAVGAGSFSAGVSTDGNTVGTTGTVANQLVFVGGDNITLSQSANAGSATVTIDAVTSGGGGFTFSYFNPQDAYLQVAGAQGQNSLHIQPVQAPNVTFDRVVVPILASITATSATATFALTYRQGIYTRNASTLSLLSSYSSSTSFQYGTSNSTLYGGGLRLFTIGTTGSLAEGQYWVGNLYSTSSAGANALSFSQFLASQQNSNLSGIWGVANNASVQYTRGLGIFSTTTGAMPSSVAFSDIRGTGSLVLRQPIYYFVSGTI